MNKHIKNLLTLFVILFLVLVANLSRIQIFGADELKNHSANKRRMVDEYAIEKGEILSADGKVLARSVDTGSTYRYQREYPMGDLFENLVGYDSWRHGKTGLEEKYNQELLGRGKRQTIESLSSQLLGRRGKGNSLVLTVDSRLQAKAAEALGNRKGAVVALEPLTGAVLAMVTSPRFDSNGLVPIGGRDTQAYMNVLNADERHPFIDRSRMGLYPPGSSFKVVTAAAALDQSVFSADSSFDCKGKLGVHGYTIHEFGDKAHGHVSFSEALVVSCNVAFAQIGISLGAHALGDYARLFGFGRTIPFDLPVKESSFGNPDEMDEVAVAASSIGQARVVATPLEMALVAEAVSSGGELTKPYLVQEIRDSNGKILQETSPTPLGTAIGEGTAETLTEMMVEVVEKGTGRAARIGGVSIAGKTGTAEVAGAKPHSWFICFAPVPNPEIAVAVLVENGGEGGKTAAPIAREVLLEALSLK